MCRFKKYMAFLTALCCLLAVGCKDDSADDTAVQPQETGASVTEQPDERTPGSSGSSDAAPVSASEIAACAAISLGKWDTKTDWDDSAVTVTLSGDAASASTADGITTDGGIITITKGGSYVLSGKLADGRVIVDLADEKDKVQLVLNGVDITSGSSAPLTVLQADKTVLTLADGTENHLQDAAEYTAFDREAEDGGSYPNACVAAKSDLTINGGGSLTVNGAYRNGIQCSDDLKIVSGTVTVQAAEHGIKGNDSVQIKDGTLTVNAGGDGIRTTTTDKDGKGNVIIEGGSMTLNTEQDGIDAAMHLVFTDGYLTGCMGGGAEKAEPHQGEDFGRRPGFSFGRPGDTSTDDTTAGQTTEESVSRKGIKAGGTLQLLGGVAVLNAADDAVHANDTVQIAGEAALTLEAGDDGIHGDNSIQIADSADVNITASYEGIEAADILVAGGNVHVMASDDGFNASGGGTDAQTDTDTQSGGRFGGFGGFGADSGLLTITGGYVFVNAAGDGLDSNGDIKMTGGTVIVCGPTDNGNGPLDCGDNQNTITVTGGTLMAVGSTGMMEAPEGNYIGTTSLNAAEGTQITVTDESGKVLGTLVTPKTAQGMVFSANGMADGYYVYTGGSYSGDLNADQWGSGGTLTDGTLVTSGSGGVSGGFGFGGGHRGEKPQQPSVS